MSKEKEEICGECEWRGSKHHLLISSDGIKCPNCLTPLEIKLQWNEFKLPPKKAGWYWIKTEFGEYQAPFVKEMGGNLKWLIPDPSIATHWAEM